MYIPKSSKPLLDLVQHDGHDARSGTRCSSVGLLPVPARPDPAIPTPCPRRRRRFSIPISCSRSMITFANWSMFFLHPVADVLLWRRRKAAVFVVSVATSVWFLFEWSDYNFLPFMVNAILLLVVILFFWAKSALLLNRFVVDGLLIDLC